MATQYRVSIDGLPVFRTEGVDTENGTVLSDTEVFLRENAIIPAWKEVVITHFYDGATVEHVLLIKPGDSGTVTLAVPSHPGLSVE